MVIFIVGLKMMHQNIGYSFLFGNDKDSKSVYHKNYMLLAQPILFLLFEVLSHLIVCLIVSNLVRVDIQCGYHSFLHKDPDISLWKSDVNHVTVNLDLFWAHHEDQRWLIWWIDVAEFHMKSWSFVGIYVNLNPFYCLLYFSIE